jgi:hypothetical protein
MSPKIVSRLLLAAAVVLIPAVTLVGCGTNDVGTNKQGEAAKPQNVMDDKAPAPK